MNANKHIQRGKQNATRIFDNRSLEADYRHLRSFLKPGMKVLDVGCGTGAISKDIAKIVGPKGSVTGIDNTESFIRSGKDTYSNYCNLQLVHADLFEFSSKVEFDLIVSARVLQWLNNPVEALDKMKSLLCRGGHVSVLDYNHEALEWHPNPPESMRSFYDTFLKWRSDAGMNNRIADDLDVMFQDLGFSNIELLNSDEHHTRDRDDFRSKVGIWSQVAQSTQMVEEGYLDDELRLKAIKEYDHWVENSAISMTMKLNEVRGQKT